MNSEKLYYKDSFMKEFDAVVAECTEENGVFKIVLDKTAFYPEGGGQPADRGVITFGEDSAEVSDVHEKAGVIYHTCDKEILPGTQVHGVIDWRRRFDLMQQHTGDHIFSGMVLKHYGYNNIGFHLTDKELVIDYDGTLTKSDIDFLVGESNKRIWADMPVEAGFPENVAELEYRSKKEIDGDIRIVRRGDADICACCGTHVKSTGQVGVITVISSQKFNGGTRIFAACGKRAVDFAAARNADCHEISRLLSSPLDAIVPAVEKRLKEIEGNRLRLAGMRSQLVEIWIQDAISDGEIRIVAQPGLEAADLQKIALALEMESNKTSIAFGQGVEGGRICVVSHTDDAIKLGRFINKQLGGKGGGRAGIYQGATEKNADENILKVLYREYKNK